jgi:hypothetical protein
MMPQSDRNFQSAKTLVNFYQITLQHIQKDSISHDHCHENHKFYVYLIGFSLSHMMEVAGGIILIVTVKLDRWASAGISIIMVIVMS